MDQQKPMAPPGEDITDQILTNNQLRAQVGSLSKYSISTSFSYNGGSLEKPFDAFRPNLSGSNQSLTTLESLSGSVGVKYRVSPTGSITLSGGVRMLTPFHAEYTAPDSTSQQIFDQQHGHFDLNTPTVTYTQIFRWHDIQNISSASVSYTTDGYSRNIGYVGSGSISQTVAYEVGTSGVTLLLSGSFAAYALNKGPDAVIGVVGPNNQNIPPNNPVFAGPYQSLYQFDFGPAVEYQISRRFSVRTGIGVTLEHTRAMSNFSTFRQDLIWQGAGLGIMVMRDVYLYPNVSFVPFDFAANRTNVGLSTNINIF
jgi:hypothetical protein